MKDRAAIVKRRKDKREHKRQRDQHRRDRLVVPFNERPMWYQEVARVIREFRAETDQAPEVFGRFLDHVAWLNLHKRPDAFAPIAAAIVAITHARDMARVRIPEASERSAVVQAAQRVFTHAPGDPVAEGEHDDPFTTVELYIVAWQVSGDARWIRSVLGVADPDVARYARINLQQATKQHADLQHVLDTLSPRDTTDSRVSEKITQTLGSCGLLEKIALVGHSGDAFVLVTWKIADVQIIEEVLKTHIPDTSVRVRVADTSDLLEIKRAKAAAESPL